MIVTTMLHHEAPWWVANCPEVGTVSQGRTIDEAVANLKEATELYLEEFGLSSTGNSHPPENLNGTSEN